MEFENNNYMLNFSTFILKLTSSISISLKFESEDTISILFDKTSEEIYSSFFLMSSMKGELSSRDQNSVRQIEIFIFSQVLNPVDEFSCDPFRF